MSKTKKIVIVIAMIVMLAALLPLGFVYWQHYIDQREYNIAHMGDKIDFKEYKTYPRNTNEDFSYLSYDYTNSEIDNFEYYYTFVKPVFEGVNSSYVWADNEDEILAVSKKEFIKRFRNFEKKYEDYTFTDPSRVKQVARFLTTVITEEQCGLHKRVVDMGEYGGSLAWTFSSSNPSNDYDNMWRVPSAFKKSVTIDEYRKQGAGDPNVFREKGLRLEITNPAIQKMMFSPLNYGDCWVVEISADVKTIEKPACFKDKWIPKEGQTKKTNFVMLLAFNHGNGYALIKDLAVKGYN